MAGHAVRWSPGTWAATGLSALQAMVAITALVRPEWRTVPMLVIVAVLTVVAALSVIHAALPVEVKGVLLTATCTALLALAATEDAFGLHATRIALDTADAVPPPAIDPVPPRPTRLAIAPVGGGDAAALGSEIGMQVAAAPAGSDPPEVTAEVAAATDGGTPGYRMLWSLRRGGERRWCGQALIRTGSRAAAAAGFAAMIARARAVPASEPLRCE